MVTVELGGAVVDGVDDQGAGAVVAGTGHGSDEGIEEKIATETGALLLPVERQASEDEHWDRVGSGWPRPGRDGTRIRSMLPMASA